MAKKARVPEEVYINSGCILSQGLMDMLSTLAILPVYIAPVFNSIERSHEIIGNSRNHVVC